MFEKNLRRTAGDCLIGTVSSGSGCNPGGRTLGRSREVKI
jgi:hypothetical protein